MQYDNIIPTYHRNMNMYLRQLFYFNHENEKSQLKGQQMLLPGTCYKKITAIWKHTWNATWVVGITAKMLYIFALADWL